ncbi:nuclear transport factor 2 family protein [Hymenobacter metallilatus]|uniref:Nuclear transport factor 2 family protein n=1 Tax=Hymenobacter metallilatus TaxID=2493666 RepID=A0A3R9NDQ6_9BACT|nr:nuclear transport factor 2 family protein [Hymenobacter metallilatus]RSK31690.1 nuclear transport factor 2 family protein [Hymenobacter metallilatus]
MKRTLCLLLLTCSCTVAVAQQKTAGKMSFDAEKTKAELIQLDKDWTTAAVNNDMAFIRKLVADDCLFTEADGMVATKAEMIKDMESGKSKTSSNQPSEYNVRFYGPDMAVLRHNITTAGTENGKDISGEYRRMHVLVRREGRWVVVDSQSVRVGPVTVATK